MAVQFVIWPNTKKTCEYDVRGSSTWPMCTRVYQKEQGLHRGKETPPVYIAKKRNHEKKNTHQWGRREPDIYTYPPGVVLASVQGCVRGRASCFAVCLYLEVFQV